MSDLIVQIRAGVASMVINRPDQRNALTPELIADLRRALGQAQTDASVRVVTLSGAGDQVFCAGADLKAKLERASGGTSTPSGYRELLLELSASAKPTVALARGHVLAGGLGIFLACDLALACDDVYFSTPEIDVGLFPMMVLGLLLRHLGRKKVAELTFLGERISAQEALAYGLLNRVYPRHGFEADSSRMIEKLASKSSAVLRMGKEALREAEGRALPDALELLERALGRVMSSEDSREGMRAFAEKRKPVWRDQ
jgi:enoyl-CoA hydratase/carnithine racemase